MTDPIPATTSLLRGFCDDAAIFPPGLLPLDEAVEAHRAHLVSGHASLVGPFIVSAAVLPDLVDLIRPTEVFEVAVTVPDPRRVAPTLTLAAGIEGLRVVAVEVAVPEDLSAETVVPRLSQALAARDGIEVFVELPRDSRRPPLIAALSQSPYLAKLRTGGVRADLYPDEQELAEAIVALVAASLPFKATAGLHHALRNTDPVTGFEQHGFLNVLAATHTAQQGGDVTAVAAVLAERDPVAVLAHVRDALDSGEPRTAFRSFGTCSITEPRDEMAALGLISAGLTTSGLTTSGAGVPTHTPTHEEGVR